MTTIACNQTEMAGDLQATLGDQKFKLATKIWKFKPTEGLYDAGEFICGMAGQADEMIEVADFYNDPTAWKQPPRIKRTVGLILTSNKELFYWSHPGKWLRILDKFWAIGSGAQTAIGAMHAGAGPKEAVLAASKVDINTGMGTKTISFA